MKYLIQLQFKGKSQGDTSAFNQEKKTKKSLAMKVKVHERNCEFSVKMKIS